jgi:hypothetical protein
MWEHRPLGIILPHSLEKKKREKQLWRMIARTWTVWNCIRKPHGTSNFKVGAVTAVAEWSPQEGLNQKKRP